MSDIKHLQVAYGLEVADAEYRTELGWLRPTVPVDWPEDPPVLLDAAGTPAPATVAELDHGPGESYDPEKPVIPVDEEFADFALRAGRIFCEELNAAKARMGAAEQEFQRAKERFLAAASRAVSDYFPVVQELERRVSDVESHVRALEVERDKAAEAAAEAVRVEKDTRCGPRDFLVYGGGPADDPPTVHLAPCKAARKKADRDSHGYWQEGVRWFDHDTDARMPTRWVRTRATGVWWLMLRRFPKAYSSAHVPWRVCGVCRPEQPLADHLKQWADEETARAFVAQLEANESAWVALTVEKAASTWEALTGVGAQCYSSQYTNPRLRPENPASVLVMSEEVVPWQGGAGERLAAAAAAQGLVLAPLDTPRMTEQQRAKGSLFEMRRMTAWEWRLYKGRAVVV